MGQITYVKYQFLINRQFNELGEIVYDINVYNNDLYLIEVC